MSGGERTIASTKNISIHPSQVGRASRRTRAFGVPALVLRCRNYFDWHPVTGGFCLALLTACVLTVVAAAVAAGMPPVDGWPICTPQNGVVLAFLLRTRRKLWPWIILGYAAALSQGARAIPYASHPTAPEVLANLAEVALAAFTLPPFRSLRQWLQERRLLSAFFLYAMIAGPLLMSLAVARHATGTGHGAAKLDSHFWTRVANVGLAEALGMALATSLVLVLINRETYSLFRWPALAKTAGLFSLAGLGAWVVFDGRLPSPLFLLLPFAILVVITFSLGLRGAVLSSTLSIAVAIGHGATAIATQTLFALIALALLPLGVILANRGILEDRLADANNELDKLKSLDRLTGVANRRRFDLVLDREWQRAVRDPKSIALLIIDVDHFESYNQHYGAEAGDECLRRVAARMSDQPHRAYDLVSRYEGGKFTVLLPGAAGEAVERIAGELRAEIAAQEWTHELSPFERVTISVGWAAMVPTASSSPAALIAAADTALCLARKNGGNCVEGVNANQSLTVPA